MPASTSAGPRPACLRPQAGAALIFSLLTHFWPLQLLLSQKALVPVGLLFTASANRRYVRDLLMALVLCALGGVLLAAQPSNPTGGAHYLGYVMFMLAVPVLNHAIRQRPDALLAGLAWFSVFNAAMGLVVYGLEVDLSSFRGLNRIIDDDGVVSRVYFETTSLLAVFSLSSIRRPLLRLLCFAIVAAYAVYLAKSVAVIALYLFNQAYPVLVARSWRARIGVFFLVALFAGLGVASLPFLRPDLTLSLAVKAKQFAEIVQDPSPLLWGSGWGYTITEIVTNDTQEYQVEMQLPMLVRQIGLFGVAANLIGIYVLIRSASRSHGSAFVRWCIYWVIGFNNPWLFIPSWYLTCMLSARTPERRR